MSDDVDDLLRRAMTTLDHQVPDGYFETLASRTLARLDDPVLGDEDRVASSSAGWKAVALPEPARPPAPPPQADDVIVDELARERAARDARAAKARQASAPVPGAATAGQVAPSRAGRAGSNRRPILAVVGLGLAAAAGAMIFVSAGDKAETVAAQERADQVHSYAQAVAPASEPTGTVAANGAPAGSGLTVMPIETTAASGSAAAPEPAIAAQTGPGRGDEVAKHAVEDLPRTKPVVAAIAHDEVAVDVDKQPRPGKGGAKALPSGGKPKLGRKSLSSDEIKRGMDAAAPRAQACFAGTQGLARVRLTVAPSGQVQAVTVTGAFAGTPVAACVERTVRAATFPPWDGGPQSFGYDYLLSE